MRNHGIDRIAPFDEGFDEVFVMRDTPISPPPREHAAATGSTSIQRSRLGISHRLSMCPEA